MYDSSFLKRHCHTALAISFGFLLPVWQPVSAIAETSGNFALENLVAWCIVPFDAESRGPSERAAMLKRLGLRRVAYDWREQHVPTFEQEVLEYKKHGLEFFAFWDWHDDMAALVEKYDIHPQFWLMFPTPEVEGQEAKVEEAARNLLPKVEKAAALRCKIGLYNHGGWAGEPENLAAVCRYLRELTQSDHVGIIYNFHHAHDRMKDFSDALAVMKPYLFCVNLNGMNAKADPKILPIGDGQHERAMICVLREQGYEGPIGILDHREQLDAELSLRQNIEGLQRVLRELSRDCSHSEGRD